MSLLDDVMAEVHSKGPACTIAGALAELSPEDALDLRKVLGSPAVYGATIARVLSRRLGRKVNPKTVQRHRNGECGCEQ